jgi:hypothetical protein
MYLFRFQNFVILLEPAAVVAATIPVDGILSTIIRNEDGFGFPLSLSSSSALKSDKLGVIFFGFWWNSMAWLWL